MNKNAKYTMSTTYDEFNLFFEYDSGAYITVYINNKPCDVINVYDYEAGKSTIINVGDFNNACNEYIDYTTNYDLHNLFMYS